MIPFIFRNRLILIFATAVLIFILAVFWPEAKKKGELQKYYETPSAQLESIEYSGIMQLTNQETVSIQYGIYSEENPIDRANPLYKIVVKDLTSPNKALSHRIAELKAVKSFYASSLVKTIAHDWSALDFLYIIPYDKNRDAEYGLKGCENKLVAAFRTQTRTFCIGSASQGNTRRYILDVDKNKILITPDFTVRRVQNNIFAQREPSLFPHGGAHIDTIELRFDKKFLKAYPHIAERTKGHITLRKTIKEEEKRKIDVWYVENILTIKPSHAAETMRLITTLRLQAPFAVDVLPQEKPLTERFDALGVSTSTAPVITGTVKVKKTDKQDIVLTPFAIFAPNVRTTKQPVYQTDKSVIRPRETLAVSRYNAGYLTADIYPRFMATLTKMEGDLRATKEKKAAKSAKTP